MPKIVYNSFDGKPKACNFDFVEFIEGRTVDLSDEVWERIQNNPFFGEYEDGFLEIEEEKEEGEKPSTSDKTTMSPAIPKATSATAKMKGS